MTGWQRENRGRHLFFSHSEKTKVSHLTGIPPDVEVRHNAVCHPCHVLPLHVGMNEGRSSEAQRKGIQVKPLWLARGCWLDSGTNPSADFSVVYQQHKSLFTSKFLSLQSSPAHLLVPAKQLLPSSHCVWPSQAGSEQWHLWHPKISGVFSIRFGWLRSNRGNNSGFPYSVVFSKTYSITSCCFSFFPFWKLHHCLAELRKQNCALEVKIIPFHQSIAVFLPVLKPVVSDVTIPNSFFFPPSSISLAAVQITYQWN